VKGINEIVQAVRTRLGVGSDIPDSAALTKELGVQLAKLNRLNKEAESIKSGLALIALRSGDGGKASTDKLERLARERNAIQAVVDALRPEIAAALETERAADLDGRWDESQRLSELIVTAAARADVVIRESADALAATIAEVKAVVSEFETSLPERAPGFNSGNPSAIASNGNTIALAAIEALIRGEGSEAPSFEEIAKKEITVRFYMRETATEAGAQDLEG
jgi:hypothetical protein